MLSVITVVYVLCGLCNPRMLSLAISLSGYSLIYIYWCYYLRNSLELTLASSVCALADYALCQMSLAGWFTMVHPSGGTRVEMLGQERIAVARGGRVVYID